METNPLTDFLRDWGTSLVAGLVIPVTVMATFIALKWVAGRDSAPARCHKMRLALL